MAGLPCHGRFSEQGGDEEDDGPAAAAVDVARLGARQPQEGGVAGDGVVDVARGRDREDGQGDEGPAAGEDAHEAGDRRAPRASPPCAARSVVRRR